VARSPSRSAAIFRALLFVIARSAGERRAATESRWLSLTMRIPLDTWRRTDLDLEETRLRMADLVLPKMRFSSTRHHEL
jgi:hypothetical protein